VHLFFFIPRNDRRFLIQNQDQRSFERNHAQWFVAGIQNQCPHVTPKTKKRAVKKTTRSVSEPFGPLRMVQTIKILAVHIHRLGLRTK
jgi:hypothetical protein